MRPTVFLVPFVLIASVALSAQDEPAFRADELGRILLDEGVLGLQRALEQVGVPPLTFNQETQVRPVHDAHLRVLEDVLESAGGVREEVELEIQAIQGQLFLAAMKFLNPAQRTGLIGTAANAEFAELNTDLPEDEAELLEYLTDLRSPAGTEASNSSSSGFNIGGGGGGGGGGGLIIDGFSGGRMPNRDEIQEIRINENSFTAEQSSQTRGRTEVITRGGVGGFNADSTFDFGDESLDARNAFASFRPPYQQRTFVANISGPVIRNRLTMTFSVRHDTSESGQTLRALTPEGLVDDAITRPQRERSYTTRGTLQLAENHNLNMSYEFGTRRGENQNVGELGLPEQGSVNTRDNFTFQVKETAVLSPRMNNEVRFQYSGFLQDSDPISDAVHVNVLGAFRGGGSTNNRESRVRQFDFGNLFMYTGSRVALRMGYDGGRVRLDSDSRLNFNGSYTFGSLFDFCAIDPRYSDFSTPGCIEALGQVPPGTLPVAPTYSQATGEPTLEVMQWQSAAYFQNDIRATSNLTLYVGARYEWQTNLNDWNNIDPRLGFAYQLGSNTVIRGGTGTFHQRMQFFAVTDLLRNNGENQRVLEISRSSYPVPFLDADDVEVLPPTSLRFAAPELTAPYTWNNELTVETSFSAGLILTGSYRFVRGIHLMRDRNVNAPYDATGGAIRSCSPATPQEACIRPDPTRGNVNQLESTGTSNSHTLRLGLRHRLSFLNLNGSYDFDSTSDDLPAGQSGSFNNNDVTLPADNYDLDSEWGRSGARHRMNLSVNLRLPWNISGNTIFNWNSGGPYSHETGFDDNRDTTRNDRPVGVPKNSLTGPGFFETGFDFSKAIQLRSDQVEASGPVGTGGYYGQRRGVRMTIRAQVTNLFNNVNYQSFSGVETSRFFMLPTRARNPRQIVLSIRFDI